MPEEKETTYKIMIDKYFHQEIVVEIIALNRADARQKAIDHANSITTPAKQVYLTGVNHGILGGVKIH